MDLSPASILAALIFGTVGFAAFRYGRKQANINVTLIGVALMVYSYFVPSVELNWLIGIGLSYFAWHMR